jgi:hypothetical protein
MNHANPKTQQRAIQEASMLTEKDIEKIIDKVPRDYNNFPGMTYEEGIRDALEVVLEEVELDEFLENFETEDDES